MKTKKFLTGVLIMICAAMILTACYKSNNDYNSGNGNSYTVTMKNSAFSPATLTVITGSKVTWMNNDSMIHTVTTTDGSINSGDIAVNSSYSKTFSAAGTFNYYDAHHPGMTGVLIVTGSSGGGGY